MTCRTLGAMLYLLALAGVAQAGRPLATEDAGVLERGACEWESFLARERSADTTRAVSTQFGCGVGAATQIALGYSRARSGPDTTPAWGLNGKTALGPHADGATAFTLAWGVEAAKSVGTSLRHETTFLNLVATREFAAGLTAHANLGWARSESARASSTTWNLAIEKALDDGFEVMAETYGDDRTRPWLGIGLRWAASPQLTLDGSWSVQNQSPRPKLLTLGFKIAF